MVDRLGSKSTDHSHNRPSRLSPPRSLMRRLCALYKTAGERRRRSCAGSAPQKPLRGRSGFRPAACYPSGPMAMIRVMAAIGVLSLMACTSRPPAPAPSDTQRIIAADTEPGSWLTHGRTYGEQRFSPLTKVSTDTVGRLGLAWTYEMRTNRGASGDAPCRRRRHVRDVRLEPRVCPRRGDGPGAVGLRPEGRSGGWRQGLLRRRESRRRRLRRQGVCRRHRWPPGGARREERFGGLGDGHGRSVAAIHHHRRAAERQRPGLHRQRRRGIRRAGLRLRL